MRPHSDLVKLAQKLVSEGPLKYQLAERRIRGLLNGKCAFDTLDAYLVWEEPYRPQFYVPVISFTSDVTLAKVSAIEGTKDGAYFARLTVGNRSTERVVVFNTRELEALVKVDFGELDQWLEEDEFIYQQPKDPYKRIDVLKSTRAVRVVLDGVTLAESQIPLFLLETSLRTRYYLSPVDVNWDYLKKADTETYCPYKGRASYYDVGLKGRIYKDLAWCYSFPTAESTAIAGHVCYYNEKVDIWVDGVLQKR